MSPRAESPPRPSGKTSDRRRLQQRKKVLARVARVRTTSGLWLAAACCLAILSESQSARALVLDDFETALELTVRWDGTWSDESPNQAAGTFAAPFRKLALSVDQLASGDVHRMRAGGGVGGVEKIDGATSPARVGAARFLYHAENAGAFTAPGTPFVDLLADGATRFEVEVIGFDTPLVNWSVIVCYPSVAFPPARCAITEASSSLSAGVNTFDFANLAFLPEIDLTQVTGVGLVFQAYLGTPGPVQGEIPPTAEGPGVFLAEFRTGGQPIVDTDEDGVPDAEDNCPNHPNPEQTDTDGDLEGDVCDQDDDEDGVLDQDDVCPLTADPDQADDNEDGMGNACTHDLAVTKITAPQVVKLTSGNPVKVARVKVTIQNQSPHVETIPDSETLAELVRLEVEALHTCPDLTALPVHDKIDFPIAIKPKKSTKAPFDVTFTGDCVPDPEKSVKQDPEHDDYRLIATVDHAALDGNADTDPVDDACPRTVTPPHRLDPNPDGKLKDDGCGTKRADKTFGDDVQIDVADER